MSVPKYRRQSHGSITIHLEYTKCHCLTTEDSRRVTAMGFGVYKMVQMYYCYHNTSITMKRQEINRALPHTHTHTCTLTHKH